MPDKEPNAQDAKRLAIDALADLDRVKRAVEQLSAALLSPVTPSQKAEMPGSDHLRQHRMAFHPVSMPMQNSGPSSCGTFAR